MLTYFLNHPVNLQHEAIRRACECGEEYPCQPDIFAKTYREVPPISEA